MRNLIVAGSMAHARAIIKWCRFDPKFWFPAVYGQVLTERYKYAHIVRPTEDLQPWQWDWILETLIPAVDKGIAPIPVNWRLTDPETEGPQYPQNEVFA
jgi:hypothetical protein